MSTGWKQQRFPIIPFGCTLALLGLTLLPRVNYNPRLAWSVAGAGLFLLVWELALWLRRRGTNPIFPIEYAPIKSHWVQACVQFAILMWWGVYWLAPDGHHMVYAELPLVLAQMLFLYSLEGLVNWTRGRTWRLGFGPLPIILSTNLLLWFKDDWFIFQFAMVALGLMGKQFMTWHLAERKGHIFNPSAFGQSLVALVLIATAMTKEMTWGPQIAATFEVPYMLVVIFFCGIIVQFLFGVTLMTLAAAVTLCLVNLIYTQITGVYFFVNISIAAPIFLGIHLLITDPSTSPKSNVGRIVFGSAYALSYCLLFRLLDMAGIPVFWDKLLPVPILNLCVPAIDWVCRRGIIGRINAAWEGALPAKQLNWIHMGVWGAVFAAMMFTGFAYGPHPGDSIPFWKQAVKEHKPYAERSLAMAIASQALGTPPNPSAFNELGLLSMSGKGVPMSHDAAAQSFSQACELGDIRGCENVVMQFLFLNERRSEEDVERALQSLEAACSTVSATAPLEFQKACYLLGTAYETGRGRPRDYARAIALFQHCAPDNGYAARAIARIALSTDTVVPNLGVTATVLSFYSQRGDAEASWYVAYMYATGKGLPHNTVQADTYMARACQQGMQAACEAAKEPRLPPFKKPTLVVPGWSTEFPNQP